MKEVPDSSPAPNPAISIAMNAGFDVSCLVLEAQWRWLKPAEVLFILQNHECFRITQQAPHKPTSGSLFLFNKRVLRFFRKDGHNWRKKRDGRNVGEAHEKLKVDGVEALNCYYAHGEDNPNFQRRIFWMTDPAYEHVVLVQYRDVTQSKPNSSSASEPPPSCSYTFSQSVNNFSTDNQGTASLSDLHGSYHSLPSPKSMEVSSNLIAEREGMECLNSSQEAGNACTLPVVEVSQVLRRLEEQLSLDNDRFEEFSLFDDEKPVLGAATVNYNDGASLQQQQDYGGEDDVVFGSSDAAPWQEIASLLTEDAEKFELPAYSTAAAPCAPGTIPEYYSMLPVPGQFQMPLEADSGLTLAQEKKFKIREISPEWGFANEVTKVIIVGSFLCNPPDTIWAMFDDVEVPVQIIQDGVLLCQAPPNGPRKVKVCITSRNQDIFSEFKEFEYLDKHAECSKHIGPSQEEGNSADELALLINLVQLLLSDSSAQKDRIECNVSETGSVNWVLQELLKDKLQQWLSLRSMRGDDGLGCSLSKKEQGIIHIIAGLGYEWALNPILDSGVGVNFRDANGWTALHWAARFGRENMVAALIASGASPVAVTDPTPQDPLGKKPGSIAAQSGHKGLAGYLSELELTSHHKSLTLQETSDISEFSANIEAGEIVSRISGESIVEFDEDHDSLERSLEAARSAARAAVLIQHAFRAHSFKKRRQREAAKLCVDEYGFSDDEIRGLSAASKLVFPRLNDRNVAALSIQKNYRCWKGRRDFVTLRRNVVKIQAHVRGYQVRKKYEAICWAVGIFEKVVLRWRRKGVGLRGFKPEVGPADDNGDYEDILKEFRKQKVDVAINKAISRVLSMVKNPDARKQYSRMLERFREAKAKLGILSSEEASADGSDMDKDAPCLV